MPLLKQWEAVRRLLVVRLDNIGDIILLSPSLRSLRQNLPEAKITLMASPAGSQVASLLPWIDDVIVWRAVWQDVSGALKLDPDREMELINLLRQHSFDAAIIFTSFTQSPYPPAYACYLAGIPLRIGHSNEFGGGVLSHWFKPPEIQGHQAERNLALIENAGFSVTDRALELHIPKEAQQNVEALLVEAGVDPEKPFIAMAPGASCSARRYDPDRFAAVATDLVSATGLPVVILGSQREQDQIAPVLLTTGRGGIFSLVGKTSVPEFAEIIRRASLVLANNSSALHIADAFKRPMVILYSGTEHESQWKPRQSQAHLLRQETECSPCYRFTCPYNMECLDISPSEVVRAAVSLLNESRSPEVPLQVGAAI